MAKTSYQLLGILSFRDRGSALTPSAEISELTFVVKKITMKLSGVSFLENMRENLKINVALCSRSRPRILSSLL